MRQHRPEGALTIPGDDPAALPTMDEVERRYVLHVLDALRGNKAAAARVLGFERKTLYRKLERWGIATRDEQALATGPKDTPCPKDTPGTRAAPAKQGPS